MLYLRCWTAWKAMTEGSSTRHGPKQFAAARNSWHSGMAKGPHPGIKPRLDSVSDHVIQIAPGAEGDIADAFDWYSKRNALIAGAIAPHRRKPGYW